MERSVLNILLTVGLGILFTMTVNDGIEWLVSAPTYPDVPIDEEACTAAGGTWAGEAAFPFHDGPPGGSCETAEVLEYERLQARYDFWRPLVIVVAGAAGMAAALLTVPLTSVVRLGMALGGALLLGSIGPLPSFLSVYLNTAITPAPESAFASYGWARVLVEAAAFVVLAWAVKRGQYGNKG